MIKTNGSQICTLRALVCKYTEKKLDINKKKDFSKKRRFMKKCVPLPIIFI